MKETRKQFDRYKKAGICLMALSLLLPPCSASAAIGPEAGASGAANPHISLHNEQLTIKAKAVPLQDLVDSIAKTCDLRIFSASAEKISKVVTIEMVDWKVEKALATLLRGSNYLVVYNEAKEKTGLVAQMGNLPDHGNDPVATSSSAIEAATLGDKKQRQAEHFRLQMEMLRERIASGASDRFYETAIKTKDPQFVQNDRKLLASYETRLARLEGQQR